MYAFIFISLNWKHFFPLPLIVWCICFHISILFFFFFFKCHHEWVIFVFRIHLFEIILFLFILNAIYKIKELKSFIYIHVLVFLYNFLKNRIKFWRSPVAFQRQNKQNIKKGNSKLCTQCFSLIVVECAGFAFISKTSHSVPGFGHVIRICRAEGCWCNLCCICLNIRF